MKRNEKKNRSYVTILGARGSVPVSDPACAAYGGATTSVLVSLEGQFFVLDAGTGILRLPPEALEQPSLTLLLTHPHLDHINGLSMCPFVMRKGAKLDIYAALSGSETIRDVLKKLYSPPVWPVLPTQFPAELSYHLLEDQLRIGDVEIASLDGVHPGGVKLLRLTGGGKSVVFATDCTLTEAFYPKAVEFARGCDLLLCDGQYSDAEWAHRAGFGHNTWKTAARLGRDCGAKAVRITHHDPTHSDAVLDAAAGEILAIHPTSAFAREGEVIAL